jgi:3',5'-cyclic AMP phosphodiesterase CpdA
MFKHIFYFLSLCSFALSGQITLVKGPYLQSGTPNSIIIKWQTNIPTNTKVFYGTNSASLTGFTGSTTPDTLHEVKLSELNPYTKYYYAVGTTTSTIQGDTNNYFVTSPLSGSTGTFRFWVTGDCGNSSANQLAVRDAYLTYNGNRRTDGWLLLGDNAYQNGTDQEYNGNFFVHYQTNIMKKAVLWPAIGNHDYANSLALQNSHAIPYLDIFSLPKTGEAGGVASGSELFYSYDYGNVHFIALDSYGHEMNTYRLYDTLGPQVVWLKQDLAANTKKWTIAYFHHPPYTMGSHNSDTEGELDSIRKNLVRILERYKIDLVMCGHSHSYERSKLMKGHYGYENTFNKAVHHLDSSSALYDNSVNSCPYVKTSANSSGIVHVVTGSAGSLGGQQASFPHEAMYYSNTTQGGSFILDIDNNRLDGSWLCGDGVIRDHFTLFKDVNTVKNYTFTIGQTYSLTASWPGDYIWSAGSYTIRTITLNASSDTTIWVTDKFNCVADTFHIKAVVSVGENGLMEHSLSVFPNPCPSLFKVRFDLSALSEIKVELVDVVGNEYALLPEKKYEKGYLELEFNASESRLKPGVYLLRFTINGSPLYSKIVIE